MKRSSHLARLRAGLAAILFFLGLSLLLFACPNLPPSRQLPASEEKITRATLQLTNRCREPHRFRVSSDIKDPRFKLQTDAILLDASSTKKIEVLLDTMASKKGPKAVVECLDCKKEEGCAEHRYEVPIQITIVDRPLKDRTFISSRFSSGVSTQGANDVGIIPDTSGACPVGSEHIYISMDDEDDHRHRKNTSAVTGWTGEILRYSTGTTFAFCRVDGNQFHSLDGRDYAVLKLSDNCPAGSGSFYRTFDNEHIGNSNWASSNIKPNESVKRKTRLYFCFFPAGFSPTMSSFPNFSVPYGVFAAPPFLPGLPTGLVHTDDNDENNSDTTGCDNNACDYLNRFAKIIYGTEAGTPLEGRNTNLQVAKASNNTNCPNPCPYLGSYDGANCWLGKPPAGTTAMILSTFGIRRFYWTPTNGNCPTWYDGAGCQWRAIPSYTKPFVWSNMWYVEPVCRP